MSRAALDGRTLLQSTKLESIVDGPAPRTCIDERREDWQGIHVRTAVIDDGRWFQIAVTSRVHWHRILEEGLLSCCLGQDGQSSIPASWEIRMAWHDGRLHASIDSTV